MSEHAEALEHRTKADMAARQTIIALSAAGASLLAGRDHYPQAAQELATALRDDIKTMVGDVEALLAVIHGR